MATTVWHVHCNALYSSPNSSFSSSTPTLKTAPFVMQPSQGLGHTQTRNVADHTVAHSNSAVPPFVMQPSQELRQTQTRNVTHHTVLNTSAVPPTEQPVQRQTRRTRQPPPKQKTLLHSRFHNCCTGLRPAGWQHLPKRAQHVLAPRARIRCCA